MNFKRVYSGLYHHPRITEGSFRESLCHLYKLVTKKELKYQILGKPFEISYNYAKKILNQSQKIEKYYAIGDNPESDIKGGNLQKWETILVQTGLHKENCQTNPAKYVCKNVYEAIEIILKENQ